MNKKQFKETLLGGIIQNPTFVLVLGICPTIGVSSNIADALAMGIATTFVLICSNVFISLLRKVIPDAVRLPAYIVIIATFVTVVQLFMDKYMPDFYESVSSFIALIVVNCIILGRAEAFAGKNSVPASFVDGLSIGLGFIMAITLLGAIRQFLIEVMNMAVFAKPAGGFIILGLLMALFNCVFYYANKKIAAKKKRLAAAEKAANTGENPAEKLTEKAKA